MKFRHSGDLGDCSHALPLLQESKGGPHSFLLVDRPHTKALLPRKDLLIPLLERQPYIKEVICSEEYPDFDLSEFRTFHRGDISLMAAQRDYCNSRYKAAFRTRGEEPWLLNIEPDRDSKNRVIVARSPRYHNHLFPWRDIVKHYGSRILFIGLPEEHKSFQIAYGEVEYRPTKDLLEVAKLIKGSSLFIGNQSSPLSVAEGLKHPRIVEICLGVCDVIFKDDKAQWVASGAVNLPAVNGASPISIENQIKAVKLPHEVNRGCPPPCGWWWGEMKDMSLRTLANRMAGLDKTKNGSEWQDAILLNTMQRFPEHFKDAGKQGMFANYIEAMRKAGYTDFDLKIEAC